MRDDDRSDGGILGLKQIGSGRHLNGLAYLADPESNIEADGLLHLDFDVVGGRRLEALALG